MPMIGFSRLVAGFKLLDEGNDPLLAQAEPCWIIHSMKCKCCFRPVEIPGLSQQRRPQDDHVEVALALAPPHDDQRPDSHLTPPFNPTPFMHVAFFSHDGGGEQLQTSPPGIFAATLAP